MTTINDAVSNAYTTFSSLDLNHELEGDKYTAEQFIKEVEGIFHKVVWEELGTDVANLVVPTVHFDVDVQKGTSRRIKTTTLVDALLPQVSVSTYYSKLHPRMFPYIPKKVKDTLPDIVDLDTKDVQSHYEMLSQTNLLYYLHQARHGMQQALDSIDKMVDDATQAHSDIVIDTELFDNELSQGALDGIILQLKEEEL